MDAETLREGIFALQTRRFGSVAEVLIKRMFKLGKAKNLFHDLYDDKAGHRVEVKFSRAQRTSKLRVTTETVLRCIEQATKEQRQLRFDDWQGAKFDCNIQQVKRSEFDVLYYCLLFSDCILIFRITNKEIGPLIKYSDKQHKGNTGEGQFHVNQKSLQTHLDHYFYKRLSYQELYEALR